MAIPPNAFRWTQPMDPADLVDYLAELSGASGILEEGETIASYTLAVSAEAAALGLIISEEPGYAVSTPNDNSILMWFSIAEAQRLDPAFAGAGALLPIEITVTSNSVPPRRRQRTLVVEVAQQ